MRAISSGVGGELALPAYARVGLEMDVIKEAVTAAEEPMMRAKTSRRVGGGAATACMDVEVGGNNDDD